MIDYDKSDRLSVRSALSILAILFVCAPFRGGDRTQAVKPDGPTPTPLPIAVKYYILDEEGAQIIEFDPGVAAEVRATRQFYLNLSYWDNQGPEGLAFVPNADVTRFGLFGLAPSAHGGYFLVTLQQDASLRIFDVPLMNGGGGEAVEMARLKIPTLDKDPVSLYYDQGELWISAADDRSLYQISTQKSDDEIIILDTFNLRQLPFAIKDLEGFAFKEPGVAFFADDETGEVARYDNFPACLKTQTCVRVWVHDLSAMDMEPSGAAWDSVNQRLLIVDDGGAVISLKADGTDFETILTTDYDLEGVTVVQ